MGTVHKSKPPISPRLCHKLKSATSWLLVTYAMIIIFKLSIYDRIIVESEEGNFDFDRRFSFSFFHHSILKGKEQFLYIRKFKCTRWTGLEDSFWANGVLLLPLWQAVELYVSNSCNNISSFLNYNVTEPK